MKDMYPSPAALEIERRQKDMFNPCFEKYSPERISEIVDEFQASLVKTDNMGSSKSEVNTAADYTEYWNRLRKDGANIVGLVSYLHDKICALEGDQHDQIVYIQNLNSEITEMKNYINDVNNGMAPRGRL